MPPKPHSIGKARLLAVNPQAWLGCPVRASGCNWRSDSGSSLTGMKRLVSLPPRAAAALRSLDASWDAGYIMGMGCIKSGDVERMLILTDIEALMSSVDMGLMEAALH